MQYHVDVRGDQNSDRIGDRGQVQTQGRHVLRRMRKKSEKQIMYKLIYIKSTFKFLL
jgi:hypothetical protein